MSTSKVDTDGTIRSLDGKAGPQESVSEADAGNPAKLARILERALNDIAQLKRKRDPRKIIFMDRTVDAAGSIKYRFQHNFNGRVIWRVVDWDPTIIATEVRLERDPDTDDNTLVLVSGSGGLLSVEVEELG